METGQEQRKRKDGTSSGGSTGAQSNVFDTLGNEGLREKVAAAAAVAPVEEERSVLSMVEAEAPAEETIVEAAEEEKREAVTVVAPEEPAVVEAIAQEHPEVAPEVLEEEPLVAVEQPEVEELQAPEEQTQAELDAQQEVDEDVQEVIADKEPEEAVAIAVAAGADPVLAMDPKDVGDSDQAKDRALGAEGQETISKVVGATTAVFGAASIDQTGRNVIEHQLRETLDVSDILEARREGRLEALVQGAIRDNALRSRDEVVFLLQQVMQDPKELAMFAKSGNLGVDLIEYMAVNLVELDDLYALAAYDHADIRKKMVMTDEALKCPRLLSPLALRMGGFAPVLYQLLDNQLRLRPMPEVPGAEQGGGGPAVDAAPDPADDAGALPVLRLNLLAVANQLRMFRNANA